MAKRTGNSNSTLHSAKSAKNDEFYTQLQDIENELRHYASQLKGKTVFCNCDDPAESNFFLYFVLNFKKLKLKRIITTHYVPTGQSYKIEVGEADMAKRIGETIKHWFTNFDTSKRHEELRLYKTYNATAYPKYDNYDAIEVSKVAEIPVDYDGCMGVPITFLDKYNPKQFEIIRFRKGIDDKDLSINGKCPYFRIIIRKKGQQP